MSMRKIYRKIARKNGVTVAEIKREMQAAINEAYSSAGNDITRAYQERVPRSGDIPTLDEFIFYAANEARRRKE